MKLIDEGAMQRLLNTIREGNGEVPGSSWISFTRLRVIIMVSALIVALTSSVGIAAPANASTCGTAGHYGETVYAVGSGTGAARVSMTWWHCGDGSGRVYASANSIPSSVDGWYFKGDLEIFDSNNNLLTSRSCSKGICDSAPVKSNAAGGANSAQYTTTNGTFYFCFTLPRPGFAGFFVLEGGSFVPC